MRIRPAVGDAAPRKVSKDSLSVAERKFTFDAVFDSDSTQVRQLQNVMHFIITACSYRFIYVLRFKNSSLLLEK